MTTNVMSGALALAFGALIVALLACLVRVLRGPSLPDRVLAVDLMSLSGAGLLGVTAVAFDNSVLLDVALILIVTGFVGTAAFAQFIERQHRRPTSRVAPEDRSSSRGAL